jgi:hypothetical protein
VNRSAHRAALLAVSSSLGSIVLASVVLASLPLGSRSVAQDAPVRRARDAGFVGEDAEPPCAPRPGAPELEPAATEIDPGAATSPPGAITPPVAITPPIALAPPGVAPGAVALSSSLALGKAPATAPSLTPGSAAAPASAAIATGPGRRVASEIAAPSEARAASPRSAALDARPLPAGVGPIVWADTRGSDCHQFHKRRVCDGPRRVPLASLEALDRQRALGLDQPRVAHVATGTAAPQAWIDAIPGASALPAGSSVGGPSETSLLWPVPSGRLWRGFGIHHRLARTKGGPLRQLRAVRRHEGVDIGAHEGSPIVAAADGLVVYSDNGMHGYGNSVILVHRDGSITQYSHCSATYVAAGDLVTRGQVIAAVGDTGLAHGAHLHFEWRLAGRSRDPLRHFEGRPAAPPPTAPPPE